MPCGSRKGTYEKVKKAVDALTSKPKPKKKSKSKR